MNVGEAQPSIVGAVAGLVAGPAAPRKFLTLSPLGFFCIYITSAGLDNPKKKKKKTVNLA